MQTKCRRWRSLLAKTTGSILSLGTVLTSKLKNANTDNIKNIKRKFYISLTSSQNRPPSPFLPPFSCVRVRVLLFLFFLGGGWGCKMNALCGSVCPSFYATSPPYKFFASPFKNRRTRAILLPVHDTTAPHAPTFSFQLRKLTHFYVITLSILVKRGKNEEMSYTLM